MLTLKLGLRNESFQVISLFLEDWYKILVYIVNFEAKYIQNIWIELLSIDTVELTLRINLLQQKALNANIFSTVKVDKKCFPWASVPQIKSKYVKY